MGGADETQARPALGTFLGVEGVAFVACVAVGRHLWFTADEWDFLAARRAGDLGDLFRPHGKVHPSTFPVLVYRLLWTLFGLRTYVPYLVVLVTLHLAGVFLLRVVMRRAGVRPWTATIAASLLVLFGAGFQDILWPFQITFAGSLVFGLTQLLLANHDGPIDRRDGLALLAGLGALLCSGLGVTTVLVVGIAVLLRRGWRAAIVQSVPLLLLYLAWWVTLARPHYDAAPASLRSTAQFVLSTTTNTFQGLGQLPGVGVLLAVLLVVGLGVAFTDGLRAKRARLAAPTALLIGALLFLVNTGAGRSDASATAAQRTRYLYVVAFLMLPALAVAADAVARRWRTLAPVVIGCLVIGIPGNVKTLVDDARRDQKAQQTFRRAVLALPRLPAASRLPRTFVPQLVSTDNYISLGWLADGVRDGRIPASVTVSAADLSTNTLRVSLTAYAGDVGRAGLRCVRLGTPARLQLAAGDVLVLYQGAFRFVPVPNPATPTQPVAFNADKKGRPLVVIADHVEFTVVGRNAQARVCAPARAVSLR